ncbi:hypothetical protein LCGC14_1955200, partial [marine sediment metagenome]
SQNLDKFIRGFTVFNELKTAFPNAELGPDFPVDLIDKSDVPPKFEKEVYSVVQYEIVFASGVTYPFQVYEIREDADDLFIQGFKTFDKAKSVYPTALPDVLSLPNVISGKIEIKEPNSSTIIGTEIRCNKKSKTACYQVNELNSEGDIIGLHEFATYEDARKEFPDAVDKTTPYTGTVLYVEIAFAEHNTNNPYWARGYSGSGDIQFAKGFATLYEANEVYPGSVHKDAPRSAPYEIRFEPGALMPYTIYGADIHNEDVRVQGFSSLGRATKRFPTAEIKDLKIVSYEGDDDFSYKVVGMSEENQMFFVQFFESVEQALRVYPTAEVRVLEIPPDMSHEELNEAIHGSETEFPANYEIRFETGAHMPYVVYGADPHNEGALIQDFISLEDAQLAFPTAYVTIEAVEATETLSHSQIAHEVTEGLSFKIVYDKDTPFSFKVVGTGSINKGDHVQSFETLQEAIEAFPTAHYNVFNLNVEVIHDPDFEDFPYRVDVKDADGNVVCNQGFKSLKKAKKSFPTAVLISNVKEFPFVFSDDYPIVHSDDESSTNHIVFLEDVLLVTIHFEQLSSDYRMSVHVSIRDRGPVCLGYCTTKLETEESHMKSIVSKWVGELLYRVSDARGFIDKQPCEDKEGYHTKNGQQEDGNPRYWAIDQIESEMIKLRHFAKGMSVRLPERLAYTSMADHLVNAIKILITRWDEPSSDYKTSQPTKDLDY